MKNIKGKVALVTGGARGMGKLWCNKLLADGAKLAIWDYKKDLLDEVRNEFNDENIWTEQVDIADKDQVRNAAKRLQENFGEVDILVNNAGLVYSTPFTKLEDDRILATFGVNVLGMMWCIRAFLPSMIERNEGHVVNMGSASGFLGVPYMADYAATKWAVLGLTESLRLEMIESGKTGIHWTVFCPSYVDTGMFKGAKAPLLTPILTPEKAINKAFKGFKKNKYVILAPWAVGLLPIFRALLPYKIFDFVCNILGVTRSMIHWTGRGTKGFTPIE